MSVPSSIPAIFYFVKAILLSVCVCLLVFFSSLRKINIRHFGAQFKLENTMNESHGSFIPIWKLQRQL